MLTFSLNIAADSEFACRIREAINQNHGYFKRFNGDAWEEAEHRVFIAALTHRDDSYTDLNPYIKKLARTILRVRCKEHPYDLYTEDGEVAPAFLSLTSTIDETEIQDTGEIETSLKELYLYNPEEFMRLRYMYQFDSEEPGAFKPYIIKDKVIKAEIDTLIEHYNSRIVFYAIYNFLRKLAQYIEPKEETRIKEVTLRSLNTNYLSRIPDMAMIHTEDGAFYGINKTNLTMDISPDYTKWTPASNTACDILKVDISPLIDHMYRAVYVSQGVQTPHITWCDDKYKVTTPAGAFFIGLDREQFMTQVRVELICNMIANNFNTIIAVSEDSVYIKPTRAINFDVLRVIMYTGKAIDLPITIHIRRKMRFS